MTDQLPALPVSEDILHFHKNNKIVQLDTKELLGYSLSL